MYRPGYNRWLHWFAVLTALSTLVLIGIGGLVTSHGVGMAVPDWPTTYGYNMFAFPVSQWVGGIFYEHTHRLVASTVGLLVVALTRWLGGRPSRLPLAIIGAGEAVAGLVLLQLGGSWKGAGHFLSGIGGVVLLAALVWARNEPGRRSLSQWGWTAFVLVQFQGLLGGLRVMLFKDEIGIFHAALAQIFFLLLCVIALGTSRWWHQQQTFGAGPDRTKGVRRLVLVTTCLILGQLLLGATMRHQHAGLAIPDFPLAYGKVWPAFDTASVAQYNRQRLEIAGENPITAFQIGLQMAHRFIALLISCLVAGCAWSSWRKLGSKHLLSKGSVAWVCLILSQVILGAATIWSTKAADIATGHVLLGAASLVLGGLLSLVSYWDLFLAEDSATVRTPADGFQPLPSAAATAK